MQDNPTIELTDESLVKAVLADEARQNASTDAAIKELISRGFVIRLLNTGLEITAPTGIKVKPKGSSSPTNTPTNHIDPPTLPLDFGANLQFAQTTVWIGGLKSSIGLKTVLGIGIILSLIAGFVIYNSVTSHQRQLRLDSLAEQAKNLSSKVGKSADEAMAALRRVDKIRTRTTKTDTEEALTAVESAIEIQNRSLKENQELVDFVRQNEAELRETELKDMVDIADVYGDLYQTYRKSLGEYLSSFKLMLEFERDNFSTLLKSKQPEESKYQILYKNYMSALEKQNNAFKAHMAFMESLGKQNPKLGSLLSEILSKYQTGANSQP
jgi:hypothetical protein